MSGLTFGRWSIEGGALLRWDLSGPKGLVRFEIADALGFKTASVYLHAVVAPTGAELEDCAVCGKCWHDALVGSLARELRAEWESAGCDDEVIRRRLERWYNEELSTPPVPVSEGSQVSGEEVGPGGNGPNLAATGAGAAAVPPVPVVAQPEMSTSYVDTVAPYPLREEDVTGAVMARHLACQVQQDISRTFGHYYMSSPVGDKQAARDFGMLISRMTGYYGALRLLRAVIEHAPDKADEVARQLWCDWNAGESAGEFTWEWLTEYGIDPERISAEVEPMARIVQPRWGSGPLVDHNPETPAQTEPDGHVLEVRGGPWAIDHPENCTAGADCRVAKLVYGDLGGLKRLPDGRFEVTVNDIGDRLLIGDRVEETPGTGSADPDGGVR